MTSIKTLFAISVAIIASAVSLHAQVSVTTNPIGAYSIKCLGGSDGSDTRVSLPVTRTPVYEGSVTILADGATASIDPVWTENQFVFNQDTQTNTYYVLILDGNNAGSWFNIVSNTNNKLRLLGADFQEGFTCKIQVIPHWTLNTVFPDGKGVNPTVNILNQGTILMFYDTSISGVNITPDKMYIYNPNKGWQNKETKELVGDTKLILPDEGFIVRNTPKNPETNISLSGTVSYTPQTFFLYNNATNVRQDIPVGRLSAIPTKVSDLTDSLITNGNFKPYKNILDQGDAIFIYDNTIEGRNKVPLHIIVYKTSPEVGWFIKGTNTSANDIEIKAYESFIIRRTDKHTTNSNKIIFNPTYTK